MISQTCGKRGMCVSRDNGYITIMRDVMVQMIMFSVQQCGMLEAECKRRERQQQFSTSDAGNNVT